LHQGPISQQLAGHTVVAKLAEAGPKLDHLAKNQPILAWLAACYDELLHHNPAAGYIL
jgi:hypothetical protein